MEPRIVSSLSPSPLSPFSQIAGVSWLEKKAAAALFGTPPESTYQEALENLMKVPTPPPSHMYCLLYSVCVQVDGYGSGEWKNNTLFIAKVTHTLTHTHTRTHTHTVEYFSLVLSVT